MTEGSCSGGFSFFCKCMLHKTHSRGLRAALPSAFAAFELSGAAFSILAANNKIQPRPKVTPPHTGTKTRCVTVIRCGLNLLWFRKHRPDLRTISVLLETPESIVTNVPVLEVSLLSAISGKTLCKHLFSVILIVWATWVHLTQNPRVVRALRRDYSTILPIITQHSM